ncbi:MAG: hypothetical protein ACTHMG_03215 [Sphingomonas sp.]
MKLAILTTIAAGLLATPALAQTVPDDSVGGIDAPLMPPDQQGDRTVQPQARKYISPYIELGQIVTADLTHNDVLTYSEVAAGIDAGISTRTTQAQLSYRYERDFSWQKHVGDSDYHEGLARAAVGIAPGVSIEGGALATRARSDIGGGSPVGTIGANDDLTQIYSAYVGPTLGTHVGVVGVSASYRYGYTKVDGPAYGAPLLDTFDSAQSHVVQGSLNLKSGDVLPVGVTLSGGWDREDAHQLDQRYDGKFARLDVVAPVSRTLALEGGVGYEKIEISQREAKVNADGSPVLDSHGRFVTDESSPRRLAYRTDGLIFDAGVVWRPSPRTELEAHVGRRYGSTSYAGTLRWQVTPDVGAQIVVYDEVDTFARQLRNGLAGIPTSFVASNDPFGANYSGCVFGTSATAAGGCLNGIFQSLTASGYRARGVDGVVIAGHGPLRTGFGVGYANRHFFAPETDSGISIYGFDEEDYYAQYFLMRALDAESSVQANLYVNYYDTGLPGASGTWGTGATGTYNRSFGRIDATASLGIYAYDQKRVQKDVSAQALLGMRYNF